jgi:hypothetical protein
LCSHDGEGGWQWAGDYAAPGERLRFPDDRACAVPPVSGACDGGDNSSRVGATSRGKAVVVVRSWGSTSRWCRRGGGGEEGVREAGRNAIAAMHEYFFNINCGDRRGANMIAFWMSESTNRGVRVDGRLLSSITV